MQTKWAFRLPVYAPGRCPVSKQLLRCFPALVALVMVAILTSACGSTSPSSPSNVSSAVTVEFHGASGESFPITRTVAGDTFTLSSARVESPAGSGPGRSLLYVLHGTQPTVSYGNSWAAYVIDGSGNQLKVDVVSDGQSYWPIGDLQPVKFKVVGPGGAEAEFPLK